MEGYILGGPNIAESKFKKEFKKIYGENELKNFSRSFYQNFIQKNDFKTISQIKAKYVRIPFNHKLIEKKPYSYSKNGLKIIKNALDWANEYRLKVILDLHAAPGSQNSDWHSDSSGIAKFWQSRSYQNRAIKIWDYLSSYFRSHAALGGYDLINEPVAGKNNIPLIKDYYRKAIKTIRANDKKNLIFLEGNTWAQQIDFLNDLISDNIQISIHTYLPLAYTFNFSRGYRYPGKIEGRQWNKATIYKYLKPYADFAKKNKVNIFVGEFGINWRGGCWGEKEYLNDLLSAFKNYGFGCAYWTYKAIANAVFPDGLYQRLSNHDFIKREGPTYGWQNYIIRWGRKKEKIKKFWQTKNFTPNEKLLTILKTHFVNS